MNDSNHLHAMRRTAVAGVIIETAFLLYGLLLPVPGVRNGLWLLAAVFLVVFLVTILLTTRHIRVREAPDAGNPRQEES